MSGFNLGQALVSIAPTLATMIGTAAGGPLGPLAGTAVAALEQAFGLTPSTDVQDGVANIDQAIQSGKLTPDVIAKIRSADQHHAEVIGQQHIDLEKLNKDHEQAMAQTAAQDRDSARQREMAVRDRTPAHLAYMILGGFFAVAIAELIGMTFFAAAVKDIPPQGWVLIGNISGYLAAEAKAASAYYFGTTQGSDRKTDLLAQAQPIKADNVVPIDKRQAA